MRALIFVCWLLSGNKYWDVDATGTANAASVGRGSAEAKVDAKNKLDYLCTEKDKDKEVGRVVYDNVSCTPPDSDGWTTCSVDAQGWCQTRSNK